MSRRRLLQGAGALLVNSAFASSPDVPRPRETARNALVEYGKDTLPVGIRSRYVDNNNGLRMHILEAGFEEPGRPCVVLLHGFPELAYTWRNQLLPLARTGLHVIAPDLRGYGRTAPRPVAFNDDLLPYVLLNRVSDVIGLIRALGYEQGGVRRRPRLGRTHGCLVRAGASGYFSLGGIHEHAVRWATGVAARHRGPSVSERS